MRDRSGFTVIELLVVLSTIGVLLALIIPAVQQSRLSARELECRSRLKQIGIALQAHEATHREFPSLENSGYSWMVPLLPHLEQTAVYESLNLQDKWFDPSNEKALAMSIEVYCCPADPSRRSGCVNYLGNSGTGYFTKQGRGRNGFFSDTAQKPGDLHDGLSNTAAVSECKGGLSDQPMEHIPADTKTTSTASDWLQFVSKCDASGPEKWPPNNFLGVGWLVPGYVPNGYAHVLRPHGNSCKPMDDALRYAIATPRSYHRTGVNVLMGDGSVRFVDRSVDAIVWRQFGSSDGSEL